MGLMANALKMINISA